ncbi:hypothetical protein HN51_022958 [Arachis hypogaea]|uniref:Saposin B-type domain-containing protein n=1 Tax=Arachis hypogaea TaxID=3818 RepID=A0A445EAC2_ARAHY|nr:proactivator polypeptide-like 1 [Arachis hypogaea]XP_025656543.1 proactivator polypeptide-like 1 [Arachis hypogaea]QHO54323.1 Proactivator polypeptide-like [Arachis hypogaea]RYR72273.1 hypothetical protein Ahy_A02g006469 [Arachis hypogaea]
MEGRIMGFLFLIVLSAIWTCNANELAKPDEWSITIITSELNRDSGMCEFCEEYVAEALDYLTDNNTQNEIIGVLHNCCSYMQFYSNECTKLVDYYVPLFITKIASIEPQELCTDANICPFILNVQEDSCAKCRATVSAILVKLKDPETQIDITRALMKACNNMEDLKEQCMRVVFKYGPWAIVNAEKLLKTTDICTQLHVCKEEASIMEETLFLSDS